MNVAAKAEQEPGYGRPEFHTAKIIITSKIELELRVSHV